MIQARGPPPSKPWSFLSMKGILFAHWHSPDALRLPTKVTLHEYCMIFSTRHGAGKILTHTFQLPEEQKYGFPHPPRTGHYGNGTLGHRATGQFFAF